MRVLCFGSKSWMDFDLIHGELERIKYECNEQITVVYNGERGAGKMSAFLAQRLGYRIHRVMPEGKDSKSVFNNLLSIMDTKPDRVIAFHNNGSPEVLKLVAEARKRNLKTKLVLGC